MDMEAYISGLINETDDTAAVSADISGESAADFPPEKEEKAKPEPKKRKSRKKAEPVPEAQPEAQPEPEKKPVVVLDQSRVMVNGELPKAQPLPAAAAPTQAQLPKGYVKTYKEQREEIADALVGQDLGQAKVISRAATVWEMKNGTRIPVRHRQHLPLESDDKFIDRVSALAIKTGQDVQIDHFICTEYPETLEPFAFQGQLLVQITPDQLSTAIGASINLTARHSGKSVSIIMR